MPARKTNRRNRAANPSRGALARATAGGRRQDAATRFLGQQLARAAGRDAPRGAFTRRGRAR